MAEWWNGLTELSKIYYIIAVPATVILIIQIISAFIGLSREEDVKIDVNNRIETDIEFGTDATNELEAVEDMAALRFFSFRGFIAFLCFNGWAGVILLENKIQTFIAILISFAIGCTAMFLVAKLFQIAYKKTKKIIKIKK